MPALVLVGGKDSLAILVFESSIFLQGGWNDFYVLLFHSKDKGLGSRNPIKTKIPLSCFRALSQMSLQLTRSARLEEAWFRYLETTA